MNVGALKRGSGLTNGFESYGKFGWGCPVPRYGRTPRDHCNLPGGVQRWPTVSLFDSILAGICAPDVCRFWCEGCQCRDSWFWLCRLTPIFSKSTMSLFFLFPFFLLCVNEYSKAKPCIPFLWLILRSIETQHLWIYNKSFTLLKCFLLLLFHYCIH